MPALVGPARGGHSGPEAVLGPGRHPLTVTGAGDGPARCRCAELRRRSAERYEGLGFECSAGQQIGETHEHGHAMGRRPLCPRGPGHANRVVRREESAVPGRLQIGPAQLDAADFLRSRAVGEIQQPDTNHAGGPQGAAELIQGRQVDNHALVEGVVIRVIPAGEPVDLDLADVDQLVEGTVAFESA